MKRPSKSQLVGLPEPLEYLAGAIVHLFQQDQDLLGCGEANTSKLEAAMKKAALANSNHDFESDAAALAEWLRGHSDLDPAIAGSAA